MLGSLSSTGTAALGSFGIIRSTISVADPWPWRGGLSVLRIRTILAPVQQSRHGVLLVLGMARFSRDGEALNCDARVYRMAREAGGSSRLGSGDALAGHCDRRPDRSITREVSTALSARSMTSASISSGSAAWAKANPLRSATTIVPTSAA
jgi:hypothetical protein